MNSDQLYPQLPLLLVDDEQPWLRSLSLTLKEMAGISNVIKCFESTEVMPLLARNDVSMILLDLTMPHLSGEDLLTMISKDYPHIPVIILSGMNQVETAVRCMHKGAFDYYIKTVEKERLLTGIQQAFSMRELQCENTRLKRRFLDPLAQPEIFNQFQTRSHKMRALFQYVEAIAGSSEPVLITGESGVGKELFARAIHQSHDPQRPMVAVNVAGLDDEHFSDTLFGHTRGAFTNAERDRSGMIEKAAGGTLFLDEIGDLTLSSQVKLLRLLQEGEYFPLGCDTPKKADCSFIFATNHDLEQGQHQGTFRKDLYYRLKAHHLEIPPLRERREDLPMLLEAFFAEAANNFNKSQPALPKELPGLLASYHFPGNVRELRAMVFNAIGQHKSHKLSLDIFKNAIGHGKTNLSNSQTNAGEICFPDKLPTLEELGMLAVEEAMRRAGGSITTAANLLGITRQGLSKRLKKYGQILPIE
jgi:DNA-binding NtrC family response regulator